MVDFCISNDAVVLENALDLILMQLDMALDTEPCEVFGDLDYGCNLRRFLFDLQVSNTEIENAVRSLLDRDVYWCGAGWDVKVDLCKGTEHDIILITIEIYIGDYGYEKIYKIE